MLKVNSRCLSTKWKFTVITCIGICISEVEFRQLTDFLMEVVQFLHLCLYFVLLLCFWGCLLSLHSIIIDYERWLLLYLNCWSKPILVTFSDGKKIFKVIISEQGKIIIVAIHHLYEYNLRIHITILYLSGLASHTCLNLSRMLLCSFGNLHEPSVCRQSGR